MTQISIRSELLLNRQKAELNHNITTLKRRTLCLTTHLRQPIRLLPA